MFWDDMTFKINPGNPSAANKKTDFGVRLENSVKTANEINNGFT